MNNWIKLGLIILFVGDLIFSFVQHKNQPLDGDMAWNIVPAQDVKPILEHPLGWPALLGDSVYSNPNRYFCHLTYRGYMLSAPNFFRQYFNAIDSVYLATASFKIFIQFILLFILSYLIANFLQLSTSNFLWAWYFIFPLFQTNGYGDFMAIIDPSTTYTFFYAWPSIFLLIYLIPVYLEFIGNSTIKLSLWQVIIWILLAFVVCLSGPLNPGVILSISTVLMLYSLRTFLKAKRSNSSESFWTIFSFLSTQTWILLSPIILLSIYSIYLGKQGLIAQANFIPLIDRYKALPTGVLKLIGSKVCFALLIGSIFLNLFLLRKWLKSAIGKKLKALATGLFLFSLIYILLLPMGGYRSYRPDIVRYDTFLPVTITIIFMFGLTSLLVFRMFMGKTKRVYLFSISLILLVFIKIDHFEMNNRCERQALQDISKAREAVLVLDYSCPILSWGRIDRPEDSDLNVILLQHWGIVENNIQYYHR